MIIVLMGYMGSGKSTIGQHLSNILNYRFVDLDAFIEEQEERSIPSIFETKGEIYFRKKEMYYLDLLLNSKDDMVLSLGGGTPCYGLNMKLILESEDTVSIYLKASILELSKRLMKDKAQRPLLQQINTMDQMTEYIGKHLFERNAFYSQSNFTINTDGKSIQAICEALVMTLI